MKSLEFSRVSRRTWVVLFILFALIVSGAVATRSQAAASSLNSPDNLWSAVVESSFTTAGQRDIVPAAYGVSRLNLGDMSAMLADAPMEFTTSAETNPTTFYLPMPDGTYAAFRVWESPIMHPDLAAKFPGIKTYAGQGIDNPAATIRFDITPHGFHAQVLSPEGRIMVDPFSRNDTAHYISYTSTDNHRTDLPDTFDQIVDEDGMREEIEALVKQQGAVQTGTELRTYRLALAATGEYTSFHGGTVGDGMAAMTTAMNRVNGIYEVEVAVRMEFIANNNTIIYTNGASDPYTNNSGGTMLGQNKSNLNSVIGSANYDIGHVFSTGGGGIAGLGVICGNNKAWGVTGLSSPINDVFYVDYVAHEMGHQYGANHTFNGTASSCNGNRNASTAFEPGSASTIMGYADICGSHDIQTYSDDYFHSASFQEIVAHTNTGSGNTCAAITATGNAEPSVTSGSTGYTIPIGTPFMMTGAATDPDGDTLTYNWEEYDLGPAGHPNSPSGTAPIFRSFLATSSPTRVFPQWSDILNGTQTIGEIMPSYTRALNFRLTVRDNKTVGGGVAYSAFAITANATAGPFLVTAPNTAVSWNDGDSETVTWNVANTTSAPISCANVDINLSSDGGYTYPTSLAVGVTNDGSQAITAPAVNTSMARVQVICSDNIFFDVSNANFTITSTSTAVQMSNSSATTSTNSIALVFALAAVVMLTMVYLKKEH